MSEEYFNFTQSTWVDRVSDNPNRRKLTEVGVQNPTSVSYTVERDDTPSVEGTPFNASSMNDLESRISNITIDNADQSNSGLMTAEDKRKLDTVEVGATKNFISSGTNAPSGGNDGDIYFRYS